MVGALTLPVSAQETAKPQDFGLLRAVPEDCFLIAASHYNPERKFLDDYWAEVWVAFEESGVMDDVFGLVMDLAPNDEARAELTRMRDRFCELVTAVDWEAFGSGEVVFGERLGAPQEMRQGIMFGVPDLVVLFQMSEESAAKNYEGLHVLLGAGLDELSNLAGVEMKLQDRGHEGTRQALFDIGELDPDAPKLAISIGLQGDVLYLTFGGKIHDEIPALLAGTSGQRSAAASPRVAAALATVPKAGDGFELVDFVRLRDSLELQFAGLMKMIEREAGPQPGDAEGNESQKWISAAHGLIDRGLETLGILDYSVTIHTTKGFSTHNESFTALVPGAEENPFHPVIAGGRDVSEFARFLPQETVSFSASGGCDILALYDFLEETVAGTGEVGEEILVFWENFQEEQQFDIREDYLGWIGAGSVSASFQLDGQEAWVLRMEVTDDERAAAKLSAGLEFMTEKMAGLAELNPMLGMLTPRISDTTHEELKGFHDISIAMMPTPAVCGVKEGWMVFGTSADAAVLTQATGAGEHPNVMQNEALVAQALLPQGPARSVTFTDHEKDAETIAGALSAISMMGGMFGAAIPDEEAREIVARLAGIVGKLAPVAGAIDFYDASASYTTFDGQAWRVRSVTHYVPPTKAEEGQ